MSTNLMGFDAEKQAPMDTFEAIPEGEYKAIITDSEMKPTKSGTGQYLQMTIEIVEGEYKNRKLWSRLNLINDNTTAVELAQKELSSICRAVGILRPRDSAELHGKPIVIKVGTEKRKDTGDITNRIKGYEPLGTTAVTTTTTAPAPTPVPAAPAKPAAATPPWRA